MSYTKQRLFEWEEKQKKPYRTMPDDELGFIVGHDTDHDCRCSDPEGYCSTCYYADLVLQERSIESGHYI